MMTRWPKNRVLTPLQEGILAAALFGNGGCRTRLNPYQEEWEKGYRKLKAHQRQDWHINHPDLVDVWNKSGEWATGWMRGTDSLRKILGRYL